MKIRVYEPARCCNTGVCGVDLDENLVNFTADLAYLKTLGVDIERHNLANDPTVFVANDTVRTFLETAGSDGLPLTQVEGGTVMTGKYPSRDQLLRFASIDLASKPKQALNLIAANEGACCSPSGSSCC